MVMELRENIGRLLLSSLFALLLLLQQITVPGSVQAVPQEADRLSGGSGSSSIDVNFAHSANKPVVSTEVAKRIRLASEMRIKWRLAEAETLWREVLARDTTNREALIGLAEIERTRLNYPQAFNL